MADAHDTQSARHSNGKSANFSPETLERFASMLSGCESVCELVQALGGWECLLKICSRWGKFLADSMIVPPDGAFDRIGWEALLGMSQSGVKDFVDRNQIPDLGIARRNVHDAQDVFRFAKRNPGTMEEIDHGEEVQG